MATATETEFNPYEELGRTRKAARLAVECVRRGIDDLPEDPSVDAGLRECADALGIARPSDETLALVRALVKPLPLT